MPHFSNMSVLLNLLMVAGVLLFVLVKFWFSYQNLMFMSKSVDSVWFFRNWKI